MHAARSTLLSVIAFVMLTTVAAADVSLPAIFGEGMVLQRHKPVTIWGTADPDEQVTVSFADQEATATADDEGRWRVTLDPLETSREGRTLRVESDGDIVEFDDVLVGEVWLGSGQSNMEWTMAMLQNEDAIEAADDSQMRLFTVEKAVADTEQNNFTAAAGWSDTSPQSVRHFSAVAYYFGQVLRRELDDVPVGLVVSAWGGTPAEAWTPRDELEAELNLQPLLQRWDNAVADDAEQTNSPHRPANLYNAMIAPITDLSIRGVIWYQGESNVTRAHQYRTLFPLMIDAWRRSFGQGDFPFHFVQIAPFDYGDNDPAEAAELWEAQLLTLKAVNNTGMAVTTDIGDVRDIHPRNKIDVGRRLAAWALAYTYHLDVTPSGPIYTHHAIENDRVRLYFDYPDGLAASDDEPLSHFTVAGADGQFHPATAEVEGDTLVVSSDQVDHPIAVRFAWEDTAEPNFVNAAGLPASPFRTDSFPLLTRGRH